ncbi:MAG TPA: alpha/beta hydrolase [Candidatus Saccharimonadales bacterium]|nr:alpha/beta hydrolase [Candidatus Saccharimonadales bacterium]
MKLPQTNSNSYQYAPNKTISVGKTKFAYRDLGPEEGMPIVLLNHWGAVLDNFDPYIVDALAKSYRVIAVDYRGIGYSSGIAPLSVGEMADDTIALIRTLGFNKIDLFGFSLGGMVAQDVIFKAPQLVSKLILTGTGPAGGRGINKVGAVSWPLIIKALLTLRDPKYNLFFTPSQNSQRAAKEFLARLKERKIDRDKGPTPRAFLRQLKAIHAWGDQAPQDLGVITVPVLVANGDNDLMVPSENTIDLARRIKDSELIIYKDAGHGGIFQYHEEFVKSALSFLGK